MKKNILTISALLLNIVAFSQVNVGTNTNTLTNKNTFLDASGFTETAISGTGKGLNFPRTNLTTFAFDTSDLGQYQYFKTGFDGLVVYNTATGKTGTNTATQGQQIDVTPGFYYFSNPTATEDTTNLSSGKWVRLSDSQANDQLWAQRDNNGIIETYLKPSLGTNDILGFYEDKTNKNKGFLRIAGILSPLATSTTFYKRSSINFENYGSDAFPLTHPYTNTAFYDFNHRRSVVTSGHVNNSTSTAMRYNGGYNTLLVQDPNISKPLNYLNGQTFEVLIEGEDPDGTGPLLGATLGVNANTMVGLQSWARANTSGNLGSLEGFKVVGRSIGSGATIGRFTGQNMDILVSNNQSASVVRGINNQMALETGQVSNMGGLVSYITSKASNISTGKGMDLRYIASDTGSTMTEYVGVFNSFTLGAGNSVDDFYGYRLHIPAIGANSTVKNAYGLHLDNVNFSTGNNYAIYTNAGTVRFGDNVGIGVDAPVEKLEVAGNILAKEAELRSERSSNIGGSLELSNTLKADTTTEVGKWRLFNMKTGGAYNYISGLHFWAYGLDNSNKSSKMVLTDEGKLAIGYGSNASEMPKITELLNVNGNVKATAFMGTNGAKLFPDYVFQKYYTGTSNIKADYSFKTLSQVEDFVKANGHLPGYQSAAEIKKQGYIDIMATQLTNVEKIEELYLHLLEKDKEVKDLKAKNEELESRLQKLEALLVK
ncbi:hypothetical protein PG279_00430 [Riemerella anatipestifer]|uniref:hypothetical protein n=1 Tax=Riemerella anatipestifer TaxID=34085 RepID=UPI001375074C|nr:hypothetical protein [Riemerella anatipestifer]MDY3337641.1 hypothetical protein [Riemerella anatipestifer]